MAFAPAPEPPSPLGRYRLLSPNAGVRVSPLCLGAMNIGTAWEKMMGAVPKEESFKLLDYFYDQGGNFIDVMSSVYGEIDGRLQTRIKMRKVRLGLVNGWRNEATVIKSCLPPNLHPLTRTIGRITPSKSITLAIRQRVCTSPSKTVSRNCKQTTSI